MAVRRVVEGVQMVHIGPNTALTLTAINYALLRASYNRMYAKFYTDKWFIQVNFMRDGTINVSTNIRHPSCIADMWKKEKQGWSIGLAKQFVYQWMQISRRVLG